MSAINTTYPKRSRPQGKTESIERLKALARLLARQAAAQLLDANRSTAST
jgi:hypothetical protein